MDLFNIISHAEQQVIFISLTIEKFSIFLSLFKKFKFFLLFNKLLYICSIISINGLTSFIFLLFSINYFIKYIIDKLKIIFLLNKSFKLKIILNRNISNISPISNILLLIS